LASQRATDETRAAAGSFPTEFVSFANGTTSLLAWMIILEKKSSCFRQVHEFKEEVFLLEERLAKLRAAIIFQSIYHLILLQSNNNPSLP
jgi:hypothetical protein